MYPSSPSSSSMIVRGQARRLARQPKLTPESVAKAAAVTLRAFSPSADPKQMLKSYTDFVRALCSFPDDSAQAEYACSALGMAFADVYAAGVSRDDRTILILESFVSATLKRARAEPEGSFDRFFAPKLTSMLRAYVMRQKGITTIQQTFPDASDPLLAQSGDLGQVISDLAGLLAEQRAYGVKPCFFRDGFFHGPKDVWVFADGMDRASAMDPDELYGFARPLALTNLAEGSSISHLRPTVRRRDDAIVELLGHHPKLLAAVQLDGTMTTDSMYAQLPLRDMFALADREAAYEPFVLAQLMRVTDLVVPIEMQRTFPVWPRLPARKSEREAFLADQPRLFRELVIPRIRALADPQGLAEAMEREVARALLLTEQLTPRERKIHDVVGFLRPLPRGHKAGPEGQKLAFKERGITEIPEGYTYVRGHRRGNIPDNTIGHVVRRRQP